MPLDRNAWIEYGMGIAPNSLLFLHRAIRMVDP